MAHRKAPNAWEDDDWEVQADKAAAEGQRAPAEPQVPLTKKERLAQHVELNRRLWQDAEEPNNGAPLHFLTTSSTPPLAQPLKAPMTVLARKPPPTMIAKRDPVTGLESLRIDNDSDDERDAAPRETPEEMRARQQREREEKQRRYDEARARLFGEDTSAGAAGGSSGGKSGRSSGTSTPGNVTPPRGGGERRGRGRGRGGFRGNDHRTGRGPAEFQRPASQSTAEARNAGLYDPNYSPKPAMTIERRGGARPTSTPTPRDDIQAIRAPRGPDGGGRGGFGFANRGAKGE